MRNTVRFAAVSAFALALVACGPSEEPAVDEADVAADDMTGDVVDTLPDAAEPTPEATETPADEATPTPAASASATPVPAAVPTVAAAPAAFTQCRVCHSVSPGQNGIGPSLAGIHGNRAGAVTGFTYTDGMKNSGLTWNDATLNRYLTDPSGVVPGTMMAIGPLDAAQRAAIIAYLKTL